MDSLGTTRGARANRLFPDKAGYVDMRHTALMFGGTNARHPRGHRVRVRAAARPVQHEPGCTRPVQLEHARTDRAALPGVVPRRGRPGCWRPLVPRPPSRPRLKADTGAPGRL